MPRQQEGICMSAQNKVATAIYWFRNDLRLGDNLALLQACAHTGQLLPVYCHPADVNEPTDWGCQRVGKHRQRFLQDTLQALRTRLRALGSDLLEVRGPVSVAIPLIAQQIAATHVWCEDIAAPYEQDEVQALRKAGLQVNTVWQSSLLTPDDLPFDVADMPDVFTTFRQSIERAHLAPRAPQPAPTALPPLPAPVDLERLQAALAATHAPPAPLASDDEASDTRSSFPYTQATWQGGEDAALAHVQRYFERGLAHSYKATRNGLSGTDYSSKWSPWLATGALSPRVIYQALQACEARDGASDGSYWLWFELLWRDHFRFLHLQHGRKLYRPLGLARTLQPHAPQPGHKPKGFAFWCQGRTGQPLVDAGMRELASTGYLSNRMRQIVASHLLHDLGGDWRAGAAWFEHQLIDFDVYSNQGNWLYISGRGTDPRGGRRFNLDKQTQDHDRDGSYRRLWGTA